MSNNKKVYQRRDEPEPEAMLMSSILSDNNQEQLQQTRYAIRGEALLKTNGRFEWEKWFGMTDEQASFVREVLQQRQEFMRAQGYYPKKVYVTSTYHALLGKPVAIAGLEVAVMSEDSFMLE